ncbi:MAG: hypothetical protein GY847_23400 [Proteobacteria bacterium]|nr:hypothetical protein [Pseudomonadota bacterium]
MVLLAVGFFGEGDSNRITQPPVEFIVVEQPSQHQPASSRKEAQTESQNLSLPKPKPRTVAEAKKSTRPKRTRRTAVSPEPGTILENGGKGAQVLADSTQRSDSIPLGDGGPAIALKDPAELLNKDDLELDWNGFETTFGKEAEKEREEYAVARRRNKRSTLKLGGFSDKVRRAINVHRGWIRPGNQEILGKRHTTFKEYIALLNSSIRPHLKSYLHSIDSTNEQMHRKMRSGFMRNNPFYAPPPLTESANSLSSRALGDLSLRTLTEMEILATGELNEIRVILTSGNSVFDAITVSSIYQGSPFPPPPGPILSWNQRTYLRFAFHRDWRKNVPMNIRGYILRPPARVLGRELLDASVTID